MFLSDVSIKRPVFATMMMVALVVFGIVGYSRLAVDEYPDVSYPVISVNTNYPGASPEVVEREITRPIEQALNTIDGLNEITSTSSEGSSSVRLNFNLGVDPVRMQPEVSVKVARIRRQLPRDILDPTIQRFDPNDSPVMTIALQSQTRTLREVSDLADQVIRLRIESVPGVGGVNINGAATRQIRVELDPVSMRAYGITPDQVMTALNRENQEVPAGRIVKGDGERLVRVTGRVTDPTAFRDVVVQVRGGAPVRVRDIGRVETACQAPLARAAITREQVPVERQAHAARQRALGRLGVEQDEVRRIGIFARARCGRQGRDGRAGGADVLQLREHGELPGPHHDGRERRRVDHQPRVPAAGQTPAPRWSA